MKDVKATVKKVIKLGLVVGAAYVAGRCTCFMDMVNKYANNITLDKLDMGFFKAKGDVAGICWFRPKKDN